MHPLRAAVPVACALILALTDPVRADPIRVVVPGDQATTNGNIDNVIPFGGGYDSFRYQQVYAGSQFPSEPFLITSLAFRPQEGSPASPDNSNGRSTIPSTPTRTVDKTAFDNDHPSVRWPGVSVFFAAHDEHRTFDVGNVIDRPQLRN